MKTSTDRQSTQGDQADEVLRVLGKAHHTFNVVYGAVLVLGWLGVQVVLMYFLMPRLTDLYADADVELPRVTTFLIQSSQWLNGGGANRSSPGWYLAAPIALIAALGLIYFMHRVRFSFYLVAMLLIASVLAEFVFMFAPLYQSLGNISNF